MANRISTVLIIAAASQAEANKYATALGYEGDDAKGDDAKTFSVPLHDTKTDLLTHYGAHGWGKDAAAWKLSLQPSEKVLVGDKLTRPPALAIEAGIIVDTLETEDSHGHWLAVLAENNLYVREPADPPDAGGKSPNG